ELEKLRCVYDREGDAGGLDQSFLQGLSAKVRAVVQAAGAHYRKRNMVLHVGMLLGAKDVEDRFLEKVEGGDALEIGRVGHVDDHVRADQAFGQAFSGHHVD